MTEAELLKGILDVARILGYRTAHFRPALTKHGYRTAVQGDGKGWPDIVLVGHGRILFRECKVGRNVLSPEQHDWIRALEAAGADVGVWHETDWDSGLIESELKRGTRHESEAA
jgi:hypothetical protein